jgi:hypothetical protein
VNDRTRPAAAEQSRLAIRLERDTVQIGDLAITFHRTLRIPDDGRNYPLPPSLGAFPLCRVEDYAGRVPATWLEHGGVFLPMYQREAMWLSFRPAKPWRPTALKVAVGMVNAVSGEPWSQEIADGEQDYLVCPPQPWLDGINAGDGIIRQFVAMPLGMGYTVEGQVTGEERFGGIQLVAFDPKEGRFTEPPSPPVTFGRLDAEAAAGPPVLYSATAAAPQALRRAAERTSPAGAEMGLGAGGRMEQKVYPDPHGPETWDNSRFGRVYVHIVNSLMFEELTGKRPPASPISAKTYTEHGYPWFDLYDEELGDVESSEILEGVKSVSELDAEKGFSPQQDDDTVTIPHANVVKYPVTAPKPADVIADGDWPK